MTGRDGAASVAELLLVSWIFAVVLAALAELVAGQGRLAGWQRALVRLQEARRTAEIILGRELRALAPADVRYAGGDEVHLRAVRGSGSLCGAGAGSVELRYAGVRLPEPDKDSLLITGEAGEQVLRVTSVSGSGCGPAALRIGVDRAPAFDRGFGFVFEPGSYHASDGAIRYRLGRAGRQPLTEAIFAEAALARGPGAVGATVRLRPHPDSLPLRADRILVLPIRGLNQGAP